MAPSWIQSEIIPRCPKSLKPMKFLVSLETSRFGEINSSNVNINDEPIATSINLFNSWGCGTLFVFYLPESKTYHIIQELN
ncbi:MAG: hypothetical protein IPI53_12940 [Saprospiraceae bacterium]|nr:hypothetical protein [Saprospiraceae bacterium]